MRIVAVSCIWLIAAATVAATPAGGQHPAPTKPAMPNQSVYVELVGNGGWFSINYDRKLNNHLTARVGYGQWNSFSLSLVGDQPPSPREFARLYPLMLNYLVQDSPDSPHWLELGVGAVLGYRWDEMQPSRHTRVTVATATVGYRFMYEGIVVRGGLTPQHSIRGDFPKRTQLFRLGTSFGFAF